MGKTKVKESKAAPATPLAAKSGKVTKPSQTPKAKAKELAKASAKNIEKESKKLKKKVEPESSSESDSSESASDSDSSDSSESESEAETKPKAKKAETNGKTKAKAKAAESSDSSDSESDSDSDSSDSDSDSDDKATKAKTNGAKPKTNGDAKAAAKAEESSDSSDSSDSDSDESEDEKPAAKAKAVNGAAKAAKPAKKDDSSDEDSDDSDSSDSSDSDSDDSASESEEAEAAPSKKRKADDEIAATPKKSKTEGGAQEPTTLFAGSLSWGIDDDSLYEAFKDFEGLTGARVVYDRQSGRSKGFGYVDFASHEAATKAYEAMNGEIVDNRAINLDYAASKPADSTPQARAADRAQKHGDNVSPESDTLFVGNLPFDVDQDTVREFFGEVCEVSSVRLPTDPDSGNLKGFGYVSFNSIDDAKTVFQEKNGAPIGNGRMSRAVRLDFASQRPQQSQGRGGFGGRGGGRGGGGRGGPRGGGGRGGFGGRGGGRGGFGAPRGGASSFSGTKVTFD